MSIFIENEYGGPIDISYEDIIKSVIEEAIDFVHCPYECEVNVTITDNETIKEINNKQRGIDKATDVLSFPLVEYNTPGDLSHLEDSYEEFNPDSGELMLGDIVISYDKVLEQAQEYNHSEKRELAFLTAHSMLHLFGFDHMKDDERVVMEEKQELILSKLGITREL